MRKRKRRYEKNMRTNGPHIEEVVGEAFNLKKEFANGETYEQDERTDPWHIDSAASNHMTGEEDLFVEMEKSKENGEVSYQINYPNQVCEGCLLEKHAWSSFSKEATSRANEPLQLIHADLCGPVTPPSHSKNLYFMLSIDDYSRKTWLYFQKEKSQAFKAFKKFKDVVEKEKGL
uniref:Copia-type polyprotein n=1 Tax=Tanacetum cinerariifolium TaxID=118510 RepID=A0A6L2M279_TANCI|nr:copia-type polyprotein [Tanacetum cinerariifolium]